MMAPTPLTFSNDGPFQPVNHCMRPDKGSRSAPERLFFVIDASLICHFRRACNFRQLPSIPALLPDS